ncbi:MAG: glycosyltransferase family 4 protein [Candidatus Liptonbacteria bacterium]|nr:glycosyltransferase family 4 protein [Candidatus Liptonbacteria bacterium]
MRIAFFSDNFYPELSGVSDSILTLGKELARRGHDVLFSVPAYSSAAFRRAKVPLEELELGDHISIERRFSLPFPGSPTGQGRIAIPLPRLTAQVKSFAPEVIHTQFFFGMGLAALSASKRLGVPLVGTSHTATKEFLAYAPIRAAWSDRLVIKYMNWFYSQCDIVTAPSASVLEEMHADGFAKEGRALSNPIDTDLFSPQADKEALKQKFGFGPHTLFHAGRFSEERHIDVLIEALAEVRRTVHDAELAIAGRGASEAFLKQKAANLGLNGAVRFLGLLDKPTLAAAYNASDIFLIASTCETQSLVLMQAFACGLPAIGVRARALPEYINSQNGFLTEPGDAHGMGAYAARLLLDATLRRKLGKGARSFSEQFSTPSIADQWEAIYAEAIARYHANSLAQIAKGKQLLPS